MAMAGLAPAALRALAATDARIVVTGAGGWLGLATLELLHDALGDAFDTRVVAFGSSARTLHLRDGTVTQRPLAQLAALPPAPTWVLHYAFLTKDRAAVMDDDAYVAGCVAIRETVLAALDPIGAEAVFVASSGAAERADDAAASREMRLYGRLKRDDEEAFAGWAKTTGKCAVIARIFNLTGPYINKHAAYAVASFILDTLSGRTIAVRAPREVIRGYVPIRELVSLALVLLAEGDGVSRFATGGEPLDLGEVAHAVADALGGTVDRAAITDANADRYVGDADGYAALLSHYGIAPVALNRQIAETADYLREVTA
jgi:UDP-glucuronate decarboxylase